MSADAHLKNWSLIYPDRRVPTLSPAYDLVSTPYYHDDIAAVDDLGLKFDRGRRFSQVSIGSFERLERRMDDVFGRTGADLPAIVSQTVRQALTAWPEHADVLGTNPALRRRIEEWMADHARVLRGRADG